MSDGSARLIQMVIDGNRDEIGEATRQALKEGDDARSLVDQGLTAGMKIVGKRFKDGELFLPEVLRSAQAMDEALVVLRPTLSTGEQTGRETVVIGTVEGDIHSIGKDLVAMVLQGAGFRVINLGVDVAPAEFVAAAKEHQPSVIALSALLTTTMPMLDQTIQALSRASIRDQVQVIVGGAPVTKEMSQAIGADGYARNAGEAIEEVVTLLDRPVATST